MTVFKTVLKIVKKYISPIIMYTVFLVIFGALNIQTSENSINFVAEKPDIMIINNDTNITSTLPRIVTIDIMNFDK